MRRVSHRWPAVSLAALFVLSTLALSTPPPAGAVARPQIWVSADTGDDTTGDGTEVNPYQTITKALSVAAAMDEVHVVSGTYDTTLGETFPLYVPQNVAVLGEGLPLPRIVGEDAHRVMALVETPTDYNILADLDISGGRGGIQIYDDDGNTSAQILRCRIHENDGDVGAGGAFEISHADGMMLLDCTITGNHAAGDGGALYITSTGLLSVFDCVIEDNAAGGSGGGIYASGSYLILDNTSVSHNYCDGWAGGIMAMYTEFDATDCVISGNEAASWAGGVAIDNADASFGNCTIFGNSAPTYDGMLGMSATSHTWTLKNSIVYGHTNDLEGAWTVTYSDVGEAGITGTGVIHEDPLFAYLPAEGRPDLHLLRTSPCVDSGDPASYSDEDLEGTPRPLDGNGDGVARPDMGALEVTKLDAERLDGLTRYETACEIWAQTLTYADTAVIATGENFPDALAAASLAGAVDGPLLLVKRDTVPDAVWLALANHYVDDVYVIGGTSAISDAVEASIEASGYPVTRIFGNDRYETAAKVAYTVADLMGEDLPPAAFIARGDNFPDALACSAWAYADSTPIVLTRPGELPDVSAGVLDDLGLVNNVILGGTSAVSEDVEDDVEVIAGQDAYRCAGATRYDTARIFAELETAPGTREHCPLSYRTIGLATGKNFPDALAGGAACGAVGGTLLLTDPLTLSTPAREFLTDHTIEIYTVDIYGGTVAVSEAVRAAVLVALD